MSEPTTTPTESPVIMWIITDHTQAIEALASSPADSLDAITLRANYEGVVNLARTLNTSENLTNRFTALTAENDDLSLERDAAVTNRNALTARISQLKAQLTQMLTLANAAASLPVSRRSQPDPKPFTGENRTLL
jgi:chorismate-pyruvate lyase